jgi:Protein of unknown function (DUF3467)
LDEVPQNERQEPPREPPEPIYANVVKMTTGPYDLVMDFGFKSPEEVERKAEDFDPTVRVAMSLAHAKSMIPLLARLIAEYERQAGEIPSPGFEGFAKE